MLPPDPTDPIDCPSTAALAAARVDAEQRARRRLSQSPEMEPARQDGPYGMAWSVSHPLTTTIIEALADMLDASGAVNRVSIKGFHVRAGAIECTIQRVGRITPEDARRAAEGALRRAVTALRAMGGEWTEPLPPEPDAPPCEDARSPSHPWLVFDFRRVPNLHRCERCGREQTVPERCTVEVFTAVMDAFTAEHRECQEGDARP